MPPKHIVAVTAIIVRKDGRFLVVQRAANEVAFPNIWAFPGGKVDDDEDMHAALRREILEETGLAVGEHFEYLKDYAFTRPDGHHVVGVCFLASALTTDVRLSEDFQAFRWVTADELEALDHIRDMHVEARLAERMLAKRTL